MESTGSRVLLLAVLATAATPALAQDSSSTSDRIFKRYQISLGVKWWPAQQAAP